MVERLLVAAVAVTKSKAELNDKSDTKSGTPVIMSKQLAPTQGSMLSSLSAASLSLLNATALPVVAQDQLEENSQFNQAQFGAGTVDADTDIKIDTAFLYYQELDKVTAAEGIFYIEKMQGDKRKYSGKLVLDTLTGASANGAVPQEAAQTFTRPSGNGEYTIAAGAEPLDDTFKDTRLQLSGNWTEIWSPTWTSVNGLYLSKEFDYTSIGANTGLERSFNKNNTQVSLSAAYYYDVVKPVGDRPVPLSKMQFRRDFETEEAFREQFDSTRQTGRADKQTFDLSLGFTQTLTRFSLLQLNINWSTISGYMTDPYKLLSVIDEKGVSQSYLYESRPEDRTKQSIFILSKHALLTGVADISYRLSKDSWGVSSHTLESHYRYNFSQTMFGQVHFRYYQQQAADFYTRYLNESERLPQYASADYRLGNLKAYTFGIKLGHKISDTGLATYRLEYYQQNPFDNDQAATGQLSAHDLYPSTKAVIFQIGFSFL